MRFFAYLKVKAPSSSNAVAHTKCVLPQTRLFFPRHSGVTTRSALFLARVATPGTRNTERALVNLRDVTQYIAYRRFQSYTVSIYGSPDRFSPGGVRGVGTRLATTTYTCRVSKVQSPAIKSYSVIPLFRSPVILRFPVSPLHPMAMFLVRARLCT